MKKIFLAITLVGLLCGCKENVSFKKVWPIPDNTDLGNLVEGTFPASFTTDDINWRGGNVTLTLYSEDVYDAGEVASLKKGDTLVFAGNEIVITDLKLENGFLTVNGGIEEGGAYLQERDGDTWRSCLLDDHSFYEKIGEVELLLDEDFTFIDCGAEPDDPIDTIRTEQKAHIDNLPEYKKNFIELDTKVQVKDGKIIAIIRRWIP